MEELVFDVDVKPVGAVGEVVSEGGGLVLPTVKLMFELVVVLPAASLAMAVIVCAPFAKVLVSRLML